MCKIVMATAKRIFALLLVACGHTVRIKQVRRFLIAGSLVLGMSVTPVGADTIHVPGDHPTIQEGIDAAENGDEVVVADGVYTGEGNKDLDFGGRSITVRSENGPKDCIIDCEQDGRGVIFHSGETRLAILEGFTITNGDPAGSGGGIRCEDFSSPTISDCIITNNVAIAKSGSGSGGGIKCEGSSHPAIVGCTISNNTAGRDGGGIDWEGEVDIEDALDITDCIISGNTAIERDAGGIFLRYGAPNISGCTIENNTTDGDGGGILFWYSAPKITNCTISGNSIVGISGNGGGVHGRSSEPGIVIAGCTISDNTASDGGGLYAELSADVSISDCVFTGNTAIDGGGIYTDSSFIGTVTNCTIADNSVILSGGGVFAGGDGTFVNCNIADNVSEYGGGIVGSGTFLNCSLTGNFAGHLGGGIECGHSALLINCTIAGNSVNWAGGGIASYVADTTFVNCLIADNFAADEGGGIYCFNFSPTLLNCTITGNVAGLRGGGLHVQYGSSPVITNSILWGDDPQEINVGPEGGTPQVTYSDVEGGGWPGVGNIDRDPRFVDPDGPDNDPDTWEDNNRHLILASPCIDAGDPYYTPEPGEVDIDGEPRLVDGDGDEEAPGVFATIDMGADEYRDCNENGVPDYKDVADGTSEDCSANGIPDECEPDCNDTGQPDSCDIFDGKSQDCNDNQIPDECESDADCNDNDVQDICDLAAGSSADCNGNEVPDECDIDDETSEDCDGNGIPDECLEPVDDCNTNGIPDVCDIAGGTSEDCNDNAIPDECEPSADCNDNGVQDICDLAAGTSPDCNYNDVPDECDIADGTSEDDDGNGLLDECEAVVVSVAGPAYAMPGETVVFEFMISADPEFLLRGYVIKSPCALAAQEGATGTVDGAMIYLDETRSDWVVCGPPCNCTCASIPIVDNGDCAGDPALDPRIGWATIFASDSPAVGVGPAYLAETSYTISSDATGSFDFEFVNPETPVEEDPGCSLRDNVSNPVFANWIGTTVVIVECLANGDCDDGDDCTIDMCYSEKACGHEIPAPVYGDLCLPYDPPNGPQPGIDDILCELDDFADGSDVDGCACNGFRNTTDLHPCQADGAGDGTIGIDDILYMLDAFAGNAPCDDPCP